MPEVVIVYLYKGATFFAYALAVANFLYYYLGGIKQKNAQRHRAMCTLNPPTLRFRNSGAFLFWEIKKRDATGNPLFQYKLGWKYPAIYFVTSHMF